MSFASLLRAWAHLHDPNSIGIGGYPQSDGSGVAAPSTPVGGGYVDARSPNRFRCEGQERTKQGVCKQLSASRAEFFAIQIRALATHHDADHAAREGLKFLEQVLREVCIDNQCLPKMAIGFGSYLKAL